jgi:hypothetical protein
MPPMPRTLVQSDRQFVHELEQLLRAYAQSCDVSSSPVERVRRGACLTRKALASNRADPIRAVLWEAIEVLESSSVFDLPELAQLHGRLERLLGELSESSHLPHPVLPARKGPTGGT